MATTVYHSKTRIEHEFICTPDTIIVVIKETRGGSDKAKKKKKQLERELNSKFRLKVLIYPKALQEFAELNPKVQNYEKGNETRRLF